MATVHDSKIKDENFRQLTAVQLHSLVRMVSDLSDEDLMALAALIRARLEASEHAAEMVHHQADRALDQVNEQLGLLRRRIRKER